MIPKKEHLQVIVKELEKFDTSPEKSYNFVEFFDRSSVIFSPKVQDELFNKIASFQREFKISIFDAQTYLFNKRVGGSSGFIRIRVVDDGDIDNIDTERFILNINAVENRLRNIYVWCRKQIIKLIKDEDINFEKMSEFDLVKD